MKKILIDANSIVPAIAFGQHSGIGRTTQELILALDAISNELPVEIELYTQNLKGISAKKLGTSFKSRHIFLRNNNIGNSISKSFRIRELLSRYDLQHIPHNYEIVTNPDKCIVTVHDAFFMKLEVDNFDYTQFRKLYPPFIKATRHIITCSEYSKKDIIETIGVDEQKITVIPWGINHNIFYPEQDKDRISRILSTKFHISNPYFFSVSCDNGRKRTDKLIHAYLSIDNPVNDLVLVWNNPPDEINNIIMSSNRIHNLCGVSNEDLRMLYNGATAAINPTSYEGFGLPILEAMACGCPAITCNNSSLPEVGANVAIYIDEPISENLPKLLYNIDNRIIDLSESKIKGPLQASHFTWQRTARETASVYAKVLNI